MKTPGEGTRLTRWANHLASSLAGAGVRDAVVSPGSRSTPFLLALQRHPDIRLHPVIDERAAAFYGLGLIRTTDRPVVLLCTSGSAPAHYAPAVLEASEAGLPLVVLSADRPTRLAHSGAPQTVDQTRLFGSHVRSFVDLGDPSDEIRSMQRSVATALAHARGPHPGPVHLNARAAKPLEPDPTEVQVAAPGPRVIPSRLAAASHDVCVDIAARLDRARRPALVAGPLGLTEGASMRDTVDTLTKRGVALFAECTSQLRLGCAGEMRLEALDLWLDADKTKNKPTDEPTAPDTVLEIGATPTSAGYARWLATANVQRVVLCAHPRDPLGTADTVVVADPAATLRRVAEHLTRDVDADWARTIAHHERRAWAAVDRALTPWGEAAAMRIVAQRMPEQGVLALGNSLPIRHADRALRACHRPLRVLSQRGVNGIDGTVAGAVGAAIGAAREGHAPLVCVLGDVTLSHDASSLALARPVRTPLVFVVLDNAGGRIFERLPIAEVLDDASMRLFHTPPRIDLRALAASYGVRFEQAEDIDDATRSIDRALATEGATLLRWVVPPDGAERVERQIREALA